MEYKIKKSNSISKTTYNKQGGYLIPKAQQGTKAQKSDNPIVFGSNDGSEWYVDNNAPTVEGAGVIDPAVVTHLDSRRFTGNAKRFVDAVNSRRNYYMQKHGMSDLEFSNMAATAVNIANHESKFGDSKRYKLKHYTPDALIGLGKLLTQGYVNAPSRGYTQIKYQDDITNPELKAIYQSEGVTDSNMQYSPEKMAHATLGRLHYIQGQMKPVYHYSDGTVMQPEVAQYMYWNAGRLTDGANKNISDLEADGYTGRARRFYNNRVIK